MYVHLPLIVHPLVMCYSQYHPVIIHCYGCNVHVPDYLGYMVMRLQPIVVCNAYIGLTHLLCLFSRG